MGRWFFLFLLMGAVAMGAWRMRGRTDTTWQAVAPGVELRRLAVQAPNTLGGAVEVIALRAKPSRLRVLQGQTRDVATWRRDAKAVAVINGGFFDRAGKPLGLRISDGKRKNSLHQANWGVFYIRRGKAKVLHTKEFKQQFPSTRGIQQAVQSGPRLVVNGKTTDLKPQTARRTGIGVQRDGRVIVAVSNGALSFDDWASMWARSDGLNCRDALNLDGGGSTQLALSSAKQSFGISGAWAVPDVIAVH